jgi:Arc/MetJ family transcription regulator
MRTYIDIDDKLMHEAMKLLGARSKREAVETALREMVKHRKAARAIKALYGKLAWEGDVRAIRRGR